MRRLRIATAATCVILLCSSAAWAYRPYDSTDADVAEDDEIELEVGWRDSKFESDHEQAARAVFNFGIGRDREIVVQGEWQRSAGAESETSIGDVGLFLKQVHRRGSLQGEPGMSVASECGALIPTRSEDSGLGGECALIASHSMSMLSLHANASLAFETDHRWANSIGLILEGPDSWRVRPGLELVREDAAGEDAEFSMLVGAIWNSAEGLEFDVAYRRGLQPSSEPSEWRIGMTWSH